MDAADTWPADAPPRTRRWWSRRARDPAAPSLAGTARRISRVLRPYTAAIVLSVGAFFAGAAIDPLLPALFKQLLDHGFRGDVGLPIALVPVAIVGLFAARGLLSFAGAYALARATSHAVLDLRSALVGAVMRADAAVYAWLSPGLAATRVINDPRNAIDALAGAVTTLLRDGTTLVALLGYLFYLNWRLTLVSLVTLPLLGVVVRRVQRRVLRVAGDSYASQNRLVGIVDDIARAWRVVRTFDASAFEARRFASEAQHLRRTTLKAATAGAAMTPLTQLVASIGVALIVTLALVEARHGGATVGAFVAFVTALLMTISPLRHLTDVTQPIVMGLVQARACFELIDTPPEPDSGTEELAAIEREIRFERVTVAYPGADAPALRELDLRIEAGTSVAFVGPSGAGKTTLVNAMLGFVAPRTGRLLVDGRPIESIRKASLRRCFAVVSQDIVLFDGSIADNVAYALPQDAARVRACLEAADLAGFVDGLPEGVDTWIGTNGNRLSGGQRQRLAIARALYKDASVWILDEAASALDSHSEQAVQAAIERWRGSRTLLLIAHRLSSVRHADCIHVLADGRVVESGNHDALMRRGGLYASLARAQALA